MPDLPAMLIVPVDGSDGANAAAGFAGELADRLQVPLNLLFAFPVSPFDVFGVPDDASSQYFDPETFEQLRKEASTVAFDGARKALKGCGAEVSEVFLAGDAATVILQYAAEHPGAMIIMGRRGMSRVKEVLLGSVSQRVLHHATCPVLVVQ